MVLPHRPAMNRHRGPRLPKVGSSRPSYAQVCSETDTARTGAFRSTDQGRGCSANQQNSLVILPLTTPRFGHQGGKRNSPPTFGVAADTERRRSIYRIGIPPTAPTWPSTLALAADSGFFQPSEPFESAWKQRYKDLKRVLTGRENAP